MSLTQTDAQIKVSS